MIKSLFEKYNKWQNRCRSCNVDCISIALIDHFINLAQTSEYKGCKEYICQKCNARWSLAKNSGWISKIVRTELFDEWKIASIQPSDKQIETLKKIDGTVNYGKTSAKYPCKLVCGPKVYDKAIIIETNGDVFGKFPYNRDVLVLNENHEIQPSPYALPIAVRNASANAPEVSMGFAPINVKVENGERYTLSNEMYFVDINGYLGKDFTLDYGKPHRKNLIQLNLADCYVICDAFYRLKSAQQNDAPEPPTTAR